MNTISFAWGGEQLELHTDKALFWPRRKSLIVADTHFGKGAAFRAQGIPVPRGSTRADLARLSLLINATQAERLVFLGDFYHAKASRSESALEHISAWRRAHAALAIDLVRGNHDRHAGDPERAWDFRISADPIIDAPFRFAHEPAESAEWFTLAGHLHPVIVLQERIGTFLRLPCFIFSKSLGILPSFGALTGGYPVHRQTGDSVFVVTPDELVALS